MNWKRAFVFWQILGTTAILLLVANIALHEFFVAHYSQLQGSRRTFENLSDVQRASYQGMKPEEVNDLLDWTWKPGFVYESETGFREAPRSSRFINVSSDGIRLTKGAESDLSKVDLERTLLVFGGSTTFGYGVSDSQTIAAHLQELLPQYNFVNMGRAYYYSAQENTLLLRLLHSGHMVRNAIFLDGANERCDVIVYQTEFEQLFKSAQTSTPTYSWDWRSQVLYPLKWFVSRLRTKILGGSENPDGKRSPGLTLHALNCQNYGKSVSLRDVTAQNIKAREALCKGFGLACITFVQPFAGVHGLHLDERSLPEGDRSLRRAKYQELAPVWKQTGATDITDALATLDEHAFVDNVHYSNEAGKLIAQRMLPALYERFGWR
jgi:hypothetical protein